MPSFSEIVGIVATGIVLTVASGHSDFLWKAFAELRRAALIEARSDWGCPSLSRKGACTNHDPARYR